MQFFIAVLGKQTHAEMSPKLCGGWETECLNTIIYTLLYVGNGVKLKYINFSY